MKRGFTSAKVPFHLEPSGLHRTDGKCASRWHNGGPLEEWKAPHLGCDVPGHLCSLILPCHLGIEAVAALAEEREVTKYVHLTPVHLFSPIIVETMGVFSPHTKALVTDLGRRLTQTTRKEAATTYLFQRLSVAVQQNNCASVMAPQANSILAFSIDQIDGPLVSLLTVCSAHHLENTLILLL